MKNHCKYLRAVQKATAVLAVAGLMVLAFSGCGKTPAASSAAPSVPEPGTGVSETSDTQLPNPIVECNADELMSATGFSFGVPENAEEVRYCYINEENPLAQMDYTLDGLSCTVRAQSGQEEQDISGYYVEWPHQTAVQLGVIPGAVRLSNEGQGILCWYDLHDGVSWCVSMEKDADIDLLCNAAQAVYTTAMAGLVPDDETVEAAYQKANEAYTWFTIGGLPLTDYGCYKKGDTVYSLVDIPGVSDMADLTLYLNGLFSSELTESLLDSFTSTDMLVEDGGKLYALDAGRGANIFMGEETHVITTEGDDSRLLAVTVDILGDDLKTVTGTEEYDFTYALSNGRWVFTTFPQFR